MAVKNVLFKIQADTAQLRKELDSVRAQLGQLNQTADKAQGGFSKLKNALGGAAAAFGGIQIAGAALNFGKGALDAVSSYESLNISFETFLGNADQAKKTLAELETFSAATPFTSEQVSNAGKALLAFGEPVDNLSVTLERLGDVSSATGKDFNELAVIYGKARVQGTLFAEDINQLTEAGVPIIDEFAKQFGVSTDQVKKLGSEGKISFKNLEEGLRSMTSEGGRFFGLTDKLGQSTAGRISTLEDNFAKLQRSIGEGLLPVFEFLIDAFNASIEAVRGLPSFIDRNKASLTLLSGAIGVYVALQTRSYQIQLFDYAVKVKNIIIERAKAAQLAITNAYLRIQATTTNLVTGATTRQAVATRAAAIAQQGLNAAWKANPVGLVIGVLTTLAAAFLSFSDTVEEVSDETDNFISEQEALAAVEQQAAEGAAKEKAELDFLFNSLSNTNKGSKERAQLIDQINSKYGTTLKNLSDEEAFLKQVKAAYDKLTESILKSARAEAIRSQLTELAKQELAIEQTIGDVKPTVIAATFAGVGLNLPSKLEVKNQYQDLTDAEIEAIIKRTGELNAAIEKEAEILRESPLSLTEDQIQQQAKQRAFAFAGVEGAILNDQLDKLKQTKDAQNKLAGQLIETEPFKASVGADKEAIKLADKRKEKLQDLRKEVEKLNNELKVGTTTFAEPVGFEDQINQINDLAKLQQEATDQAFERRKQELKDELKITSDSNELIVELEGIKQLEKLKIEQETQKKIQDLTLDNQEKTAETLNDIEQTKFDIQLQLELENIKKLEDEKAKLRKQYGEAQTKAERERIKKLIDQNLLDLKGAYAREFKLNTDKITSQTKFDLNNAKLTSTQKQGIQLKADLSLLKLKQDYTQKDVAITQEGSDEKKAIDESEKKQIIKNIEETTQAAFNLAKALIDAAIAQSEAQIKAQEERVEKAAEIADKGNAEILELEQNKLDQLRKQRERYVKQQQALAVLEIAANAAIAIAKTAAETGVLSPAFIASTLAAMAIGFAQARAQAQSAASFARGGYTGDGSKFEAAGTVHRGEFVMNAERTRQYRPMLEAMHAGRNPKLLNGLQEKLLDVN